MEDEDGRRWSVLWHDDVILQKDEITYKECRWPYRVQRLHTSDKTEYYGIFRDVYESQHAINQAIIKIQQMINTQKVFIEDGAVDNVEDFTRLVNRVGAVIPVLQLSKIKLENMVFWEKIYSTVVLTLMSRFVLERELLSVEKKQL